MGKRTRKLRVVEAGATTLGELIHERIRGAIEQAVAEELEAALGRRYERMESEERRGYRHGTRLRTLTGPTGPVELEVPRARLREGNGTMREWRSRLVPRYARRMPEVNAAIAAVYLSGGNTRRIRGALAPLLKAAPLSKSAVSRIVSMLRSELDAWQQRPLGQVELAYLYLDAIALRVRIGQRVVSVPVLVAPHAGERRITAMIARSTRTVGCPDRPRSAASSTSASGSTSENAPGATISCRDDVWVGGQRTPRAAWSLLCLAA